MKHFISLILIAPMFLQCSVDRTIPVLSPSEEETFRAFENLEVTSAVQISHSQEPGQKLSLCLTFISKESQSPLVHVPIKLYHTSTLGQYDPANPNDESTARLNGTAITDSQGRILVQTILPGDYGRSSDNRHIHTTVKGARPEAYDIHFKQYTGRMGRNFISGSDQHFLADLKQSRDSTLLTFLTIAVKNYSRKDPVDF